MMCLLRVYDGCLQMRQRRNFRRYIPTGVTIGLVDIDLILSGGAFDNMFLLVSR